MKLKNNPLQNKSYDLALNIVRLSKRIMDKNREYILTKQLLKSGTSIGANIIEANGAISKADFSSKISISYKESLETKYWLSLLKDSGYLIESDFNSLFSDTDEISKILFSILKSTRLKNDN